MRTRKYPSCCTAAYCGEPVNMSGELLPRTTIVEIVGYRNAAMAKMRAAAAMIAAGHQLADDAKDLAVHAHGAAAFYHKDRSTSESFQRLFKDFDPAGSVKAYREQLDARTWMNLIQLTGMETMMDRTAKEELYDSLCGDVPEVTEENARTTFEALAKDSRLIFQRGLARAFGDLDRRFKSHDAFGLGARIILTYVFDGFGSWNYHSGMRDTLADIERVFDVLDGKSPNPGALAKAISTDRGSGWSPRQSVTETDYFRIRAFKNGNAHLWLLRDDLVQKANMELADFFGAVLPDAVARETSVEDLKSHFGLQAKDLSFYPTPPAVVKAMLRDVLIDGTSLVLEPSAGMGNIVRLLLEKGATVHAVEIDPDRASSLEMSAARCSRLKVSQGNFLRQRLPARYTHIIMNPPFYGVHWMEHVVHAFDFLASPGTLVAVVPISVEFGETKKHKTFRRWAMEHKVRYRDLPAESFADSGTRINTKVLTIYK